MALLAEELVEEWLNRQGYFTIRGVKIGVDEIDFLAVRFDADGKPECRHIEVQASMRPVSYITRIPKELLKPGQVATSAALRDGETLLAGVQAWVEKKFYKPKKSALMSQLFPGTWSSELVINNVKSGDELAMIASEGVSIIRLSRILDELNNNDFVIQSASGADFADLIAFAKEV